VIHEAQVRLASFVDRILNGVKAAGMPVRDSHESWCASAQCHGSKGSSLNKFGEARSHAMSKRQRGNKEAKKPKQPAPAMKPLVPGDAGPTLGAVVPGRLKGK
jgi:hypothetical protein